jgi:ferredoxin
MHCDDAPCIKASRGSIVKRPDGIVVIDPGKAKGQKELAKACPYEMIWWNEEQDVPQKCTFCAHLIDQGWKQPRCVQACPTGALRVEYVEEAEMSRIIESEKLEVLKPESQTRPCVYYKNLYRYNKCFIAGSVEVNEAGVADCAEGAKVTLRRSQQKLEDTVTDNFGDFKFDKLAENSGQYIIDIELKGQKKATVSVELTTSQNVGTICL